MTDAADEMTRTAAGASRRGTPDGPSTLRLGVVGSAFVVMIAIYASGWTGQALFPVVTLMACAAGYIGIRPVEAPNRRPWHLFIVAGLFWTVSGALRGSAEVTGDLTSERWLLPDAFALPGYAFFFFALFALLRAGGIVADIGVRIDAVLIAVGTASIVFAVVVAPTLEVQGAWWPARLAVAIYPAISMWLLVAVAQLTLVRRRGLPGISLMIGGITSLLIGDVMFALGEIGRVDLPHNILDLPYLAVAAFFGCAALHPEVHDPAARRGVETIGMDPKRLFAVGLALVAPVAAIATGTETNAGRWVQLVLLTCTAVLAFARIAVALHSEKAAQEALLRRATHDHLTGLASRGLVVEQATSLLEGRTDRTVGIFFLDLDEFKLINDSLGHAAGDLLLADVGSRLTATVGERDVVVGRTGGDEFVMVTVGLDADEAMALGEEIRRAVRSPFLIGLDEVFVSTSIGITIADAGSSAEELMQQADTAMYQSKARGRNHVTLFDQSMLESVNRRIELEQGLRKALGNDEVSVAYQPIIDSEANEIEGVEALMRWSSGGVDYSPAEFMDVAEVSGLIVPLGEFVLQEACRQLSLWRREVPGAESMTVSVNLSVRQVQASNIVDVVAAALQAHGLPGEALWLEITESVMLDDTDMTITMMHELRALGVRLAVDDFGTGFSSLSYLRKFPVDRVKIDRSFIIEMTTQPSAEALIEAVVAIGRSMHLDVVAEGVETEDQQELLIRLGCLRIQGYLHSRPVPAERIPELIERCRGRRRPVDRQLAELPNPAL